MVIPDPKVPLQPPAKFLSSRMESLVALSRPADRLAAAIIDIFVVLMPAYLLLSAPLKLELTTNFLLGSETGIFIYILAQILLSFGLITFYQAYMHHRFGATVGKMIFHLRVRAIWGHHPPSFAAAYKRSVVWCFEVIGLAIPMLGIFTDPQRRILHDRICDTEVISLKDRGIKPPHRFERRLVHGVLGFFGFIIALSLIGSLVQGMKHVGQDKALSSLLMHDEKTCEEVTQALDAMENSEEGVKLPSRLEVAMTLYAAGAVEKTCLANESEQDLDVHFNSTPLAYLAKAFVHSDDADVSDSYLEEVCKEGPGSPECSMSDLVSKWSEEDWRGVDQVIAQAPGGSTYLEIWAVRHYMKQGESAKALDYINRISPNRMVASFLQTYRVKALWNLNRESEAEIAAAQAMETMAATDQSAVSAWVCVEQLNRECSASTKSACSWIQKHMAKEHLDTSDSVVALAELKVRECSSEGSVDYLKLADASEDEAWRTFLRANSKNSKSDQESAAALFSQVVRFSEAADELRLEAMRRFVKLAKAEDMLDMVASWREMKTGELWRKTGNLLLSGLIRREEKVGALKVARSLINQSALSEEGLQNLASFIQLPKNSEKDGSRSPASIGLTDRVKELLESVEADEETE